MAAPLQTVRTAKARWLSLPGQARPRGLQLVYDYGGILATGAKLHGEMGYTCRRKGWGKELTGEIQIKKGKGKGDDTLLVRQMFAHEGRL